MKEIKIEIPSGYGVDLKNSNFSEGVIRFKKLFPISIACISKELQHNFSGQTSSSKRALTITMLANLLDLRDYVNEGWVPKNMEESPCIFITQDGELFVTNFLGEKLFKFRDQQTAETFLEKYKDILKVVKEFI